MLPSLYVSHGSPALMLITNKTTRFLKSLPSTFDKPKYILVISAHWTSNKLEILREQNQALIYDFYGFPQELYEQEYPARSDIKQENKIIQLLRDFDIEITENKNRLGYDHGVWSVLSMMYPNADIPVTQLSLPMKHTIKQLISLGAVLSSLREDTLILGSGSLTHNIRTSDYHNKNPKVHDYAKEFRDWIVEKLENNEEESLVNIQKEGPFLRENHPTLEHLLPLFINYGASKNGIGKSLNNEYMYGNQSMETLIFEG